MISSDAINRKKVLIVINPESGTESFAKKEKIARKAGERLRQLEWEVLDTVTTERPGHATELAAEAVQQGVNIIFVAGGDGTVREMLDPLKNTDTAVGMLEAGGQNIWTKETRIPKDPVK